MDNNNPQGPMTPSSIDSQGPSSNKKVGPIITGLVIVLVVIIALLYVFASGTTKLQESGTNTDTASNAQVAPITNQSDSPDDIQRDLDSAVSGLEEQNF